MPYWKRQVLPLHVATVSCAQGWFLYSATMAAHPQRALHRRSTAMSYVKKIEIAFGSDAENGDADASKEIHLSSNILTSGVTGYFIIAADVELVLSVNTMSKIWCIETNTPVRLYNSIKVNIIAICLSVNTR